MNATDITEIHIRDAYAALGGGTVRLSALRFRIPASHAAVDRVLADMARRDGIHLRTEADQKTLTDADRYYGLRLGGTVRHTLLIET